MRNRTKLQTWLRWRKLKKEMLSESCYHAFYGTEYWREYYWRFYKRLEKLWKTL